MPRVCPRPCSRLATAAVFISVGVMQFVVGIVLVRSEYVYLLAGPDFWTSSCNVVVGCLLGVSASVWKQSKKQQSKKHVLRRNLLLALVFSILMLNATTLGILLLGEGNALLSIRLENNGHHSDSTFARDILAYAYVTSVCCPIVCIVVSIVSISGSCFKYAYNSRINPKGMKTPQNSIEKGNSRALRWIYTPELLDLSRRKIHDFLSSSAESSSEDEIDTSSHRKYTDPAEDVQHVLSRMAQGKRDSILSDSAIMLKQLDLRRKNRYNSLNPDGSYIRPEHSRSRESALNGGSCQEDNSSLLYNDSLQRARKSRENCAGLKKNARLPSDDVAVRRANYSKSKQLGAILRNPYICEELLYEYQNASSQMSRHFPSQYRKFREKLQRRSERDDPSVSCISDITDYESKNVPKAHKLVKKFESEPPNMSRSTERASQRPNREASSSKREAIEEIEYKSYEIPNEASSGLNDCLSPDDSEFEDVTFDVSRASSSWAGEMVPIIVKHSSVAKLSKKLIPVASPIVPAILPKQEVSKVSDDSGIEAMEFNSFVEATSQNDFKDRKSNVSSFREESKYGSKANKACPQSAKKYDLIRMATMASISEEPNLELNPPAEKTRPPNDTTVSKAFKGHSRKKSVVHPEISKAASQNEDNSVENVIPKRKTISGRSLKKMWSTAVSESQNQSAEFLDQIVDEDSLIGLSEEELIARQLRTRSIRRAIEQRIKEEIAV